MMENLQQSWKQTTTNLYKAVLIYTLAGVAVSIFSFILAISLRANIMAALRSSEMPSGAGLGIWGILNILATVVVVYGYWLFIKSLPSFAGMVNPNDAPRIASIRTATVLSLVGAILGCIPILGFVGGILMLIAWIMLLIAYSNLKDSATFPELARRGAKRVFVAMILGVIGGILNWIPVAGPVIWLILSIISYVLVITGWKTISQSEAPIVQE